MMFKVSYCCSSAFRLLELKMKVVPAVEAALGPALLTQNRCYRLALSRMLRELFPSKEGK
jgi:hypothetical protein